MPASLLLADSSQIANLFHALGVDGKTLLFNIMAFLLVLAILTHFVYPTLVKALDTKKAELESARRLDQEAKEHVVAAQTVAQGIIEAAKLQAHEITVAARKDASLRQAAAKEQAAAQSKRIIQTAHEQLARDIQVARRALRSETAHLVASASSRLMDSQIDAGRDAHLIARSLEDKT